MDANEAVEILFYAAHPKLVLAISGAQVMANLLEILPKIGERADRLWWSPRRSLMWRLRAVRDL